MKTIIVLAALLVAAVLPQTYAETNVRELTRDCHSYRCPPNSFTKKGVRCLDSFRDCRCNDGFKPFNRTCTPCPFKKVCEDVCIDVKAKVCRPVCKKVCLGTTCKEVCKPKCEFVVKQKCRKVCKFRRVCECDFKCPLNSKPRLGTQCLDSIGDCKCKNDYRMISGKCVPKCHFECPRHSRFIGDKDNCPTSFDHCKCRGGYEKKNGKCVECEDFCILQCKMTKSGRVCERVCKEKCAPQFVCDFVCPANSFQITRARCARGIIDCRCKPGYALFGGKCLPVP